jgi:FkbM family methyltransferase
MIQLLENEFADIVNKIPDVFFIEVGANDGINVDPLHEVIVKNKWSGILVEPNPIMIDALTNTYKDHNNLILEQCVISEKSGTVDFYYNGDNITTLHNTLCESYAKQHFEQYLKIVPTLSLTFNDLFLKHNVTKVDVLMIDVEGYDCALLKAFPYNIVKPKIVRAEHCHVYHNNNTLEEMEEFLINQGYDCYLDENKTDIIGILK